MSQEYRYILRIMGTDVQGTLKTSYAVAEIKGVSASLSNAILQKAGVNPDLRAGYLTESDISTGMFSLFCGGVFLWFIYGVFINDLPIIVANSLAFIQAIIILMFKAKYK